MGNLPLQFSVSVSHPIRGTISRVKSLTLEQLESRKEQAVRFTRDVLGDPERAEEIADESLEDYAERRKIQITNPHMRRTVIMPTGKTKAELEAEISDLQEENQELQDQLDAIADIVTPAEENEEDENTEDQEDEEDEDRD